METTLRLLRMVWSALLFSIVMYVLIGERVGPHRTALDPTIFRAIAFVAVATVGMIFAVRRMIVLRAAQTLAGQPADNAANLRWRGGYIVTFALCEAIALYGFVLRMQGFSLSQVAPFYFGGLLLMVYFGPRRPASNEVGAGVSTVG